MQIQINKDNNIEAEAELIREIEAVVSNKLDRFSGQLTRVEVHLSDQNSDKKSGSQDKRCLLEARLAGLQPVSVSDSAPSLDLAVDKAVEKLTRALDSTLGKLGRR